MNNKKKRNRSSTTTPPSNQIENQLKIYFQIKSHRIAVEIRWKKPYQIK